MHMQLGKNTVSKTISHVKQMKNNLAFVCKTCILIQDITP